MAVDPVIIEDSATKKKYKVSLANEALRLTYIEDQSVPVTEDNVIEDSITGIQYVFRLENGKLTLSSINGVSEDIEITATNWPSVHSLSDGEDVNAATFNKPIGELAERTTYLYNKLKIFNRDDPMSSILMTAVALSETDTPDVGDVVYLDPDTKRFGKALATTDLLDSFAAAGSTFAVGVLAEKGGYKGNVVLFGKLDLSAQAYDLSKMVQSDETFRDGIYYLSSVEAGKLTSNPPGPKVVVGQFFSNPNIGQNRGDFALIHIEAKDMAEAHLHRSYVLRGLPAGEQMLTEDGPDGIHVFKGFSPDAYLNVNDNDEGAGDESEEQTDVFPGLVFSGEWLLDDSRKYEFVLGGSAGPDASISGGSLSFGENPSVHLYWSDDAGNSGDLEFDGFYDKKEIANGLLVELRPHESLASDPENKLVYSVGAGNDSVDKRKWSTGMTFPDAARGWRDLSAKELERFAGRTYKPKFVYNIGFDRALQQFYPPIPITGAVLVLNGVEQISDTTEGRPAYSLEQDSIYWYYNSWDHAPWPLHYIDRASGYEEWEERRFVLHFIKSNVAGSGVVTSLRPREGSGVRIYKCGSNDTDSVGDLEIDIDPVGDVEDAEAEGYKVVKGGAGGKFITGPVVERIVAGTGIKVSRFGKSPQGQGTVVISAKESGIGGDFEEVALSNAKQEMVGMFPYIRLLGWAAGASNTPSAFILKFHVPYDDEDASYRVSMSANVFGTSSYTGNSTRFAGIQMDYSILPDLNPVEAGEGTYQSANVQNDLIKPDGNRFIEIPLLSSSSDGVSSYVAFDPVLVHTADDSADIPGKKYGILGEQLPMFAECSGFVGRHATITAETFGVKPGYTVAVKISRTGIVSGEAEYTSSIGFMNMRWGLERIY